MMMRELLIKALEQFKAASKLAKERQADECVDSFEKYQTPVESTQWTKEEISKFEKRWDGILKVNRIPLSMKDLP
jgi:hypothetical protein